MGKFARTWQLMGASWRMLQRDKRLVVFPLIAGAAMLLVIGLFAAPIYAMFVTHPHAGAQFHPTAPMYFGLFVFYLLGYAVSTFFNAALIACVLKQIEGNKPTLGYGLAFAWRRLPQIFGWALLTASVGILLRMLEDKAGFVGRMVIGFLGMAWSVTSFLVVPVLVAEGTGPIDSYKRSVEMLKRTWGEQIIGNVSFGLIFALFGAIPSIIVFMLLLKANPLLALGVGAILLVYVLALGLVQTTLQSIYQAAIYCYAANGDAPGFDNQLVAGAFREKTSKSWL